MSLAPLWVGASPLTQSQWAGEEGPEQGLERGNEPQSGSVLPWTLTRFHSLLPAGPPATGLSSCICSSSARDFDPVFYFLPVEGDAGLNNSSIAHGGCRDGLMVYAGYSRRACHPRVPTLFGVGVTGGSMVVKIIQDLGQPDVGSKPNSPTSRPSVLLCNWLCFFRASVSSSIKWAVAKVK